MKLQDQARSMAMLSEDPALKDLTRLEAPYLDLEVRGAPALSYFARTLWQPVMEQWAQGGSHCACQSWQGCWDLPLLSAQLSAPIGPFHRARLCGRAG